MFRSRLFVFAIAPVLHTACTIEPRDPIDTRGDPPPIETTSRALAPGYCASSGGSTLYESIQRVSVTINANQTATILVDVFIANPNGCTAGSPCPEYDNSPEHVNAWIDWNNDQAWSLTERVMDQDGTGYTNINYRGTMSFSTTVPIPAAAGGVTYARANLGWASDPNDPCQSSWRWGHVEDALVTLDTPRIEAIMVGPTNPETTRDVTLTAQIHHVPGFTVTNVHWSGDVSPAGDGNPSYTYRPAQGTHGHAKHIEALLTYSHDATGALGQNQFSHDFDLFFVKLGDEDGDGEPNWWEYWPRAGDGATSIGDGAPAYRYAVDTYFGQYDGNSASPTIYLTDVAAGDCSYSDRLPRSGTVVYDFSTLGRGIDCVEATLAHERQHHQIDLDNGPGGAWDGLPDSDGDELPDSIEMGLASLGFNSMASVSFPSFAISGDDEEVYCEIAGYGRTGIATNDFASPGKQTQPSYRAFGGTTSRIAHFTGNAADRGADLDGDLLFDQLILEVELDVVDAGEYHLAATANDALRNLVSAEATVVLAPGLNTVALEFDGPTLRNFGASGPIEVYYLGLEGGAHRELSPGTYWTAPYVYDQFDTSIAYFDGGFSDLGSDTDGDGRFDQILVQAGVHSDSSSLPVEVIGWLRSASGANLGSARATVTLSPGANTVTLAFAASAVRHHREPGPYALINVELWTGGARIDFRGEPHLTAPYQIGDFDSGAASLAGTYSDRGVDLSGNGIFDQLIVGVDVLTSTSGTHFAWVSIADAQGSPIARRSGQAVLSPGAGTIEVVFDSAELVAHGVDGPWLLDSVELYEPRGTLADRGGGYWTGAHSTSNFSAGLVVIRQISGESTTDPDGDGLFDALELAVDVVPEGDGVAFVLGRLMTAGGRQIGWAGNQALAAAGVSQTISLSFAGTAINGSGEDGPYYLDVLQAYHSLNPALIVTRFDYWVSGPYSAASFERGAVVAGRVFDLGWAPAPGVGLSLASGEFTHSNQLGEYRLISGTGGALAISIDSGGFPSAPRIFVDGTPAGAGVEHTIDVALGAERRVDFVFAPPDPTPPAVIVRQPSAGAHPGYRVISLDVEATDADSGVVALSIDIDGTPRALGERLTMNDLGAGVHVLTAVARDFEGNQGTATVSFEVVPAIDTTPPEITIVAPADGAVLRTDESVIADARAEDAESLVETFVLTLDGNPLAVGERLEPALLGLGTHTISATAIDYAGNMARATSTFTVALPDASAPEIVIRAPLAQTYDWNDTVVLDVVITDDDSGVASATIALDGRTRMNRDVVVMAELGLGSHALTVDARDFAGNRSSEQLQLEVADRRAPMITVRSPRAIAYDRTTASTIIVDVTANDAESGLETLAIEVDGRVRQNGDVLDLAELGDGDHRLFARAKDFAGATATATVTFSIVSSPAQPSPAGEEGGCGCTAQRARSPRSSATWAVFGLLLGVEALRKRLRSRRRDP